jgi:hypothetical protein
MNNKTLFQKYAKLIPIIRNSQKPLRTLANELKLSVNTLRSIKEAITTGPTESQTKTARKTIRFTHSELQAIEAKAKQLNMDVSSFVRGCLKDVLGC